ncbi:PepSY domain-containing protein [Pseudooceanicola sp. 216_PA32_1]|uniref:PepSY domain-containing protein n=1 Tax=Pseudooceanicola pacificus TaxID=2676438 RepID=A0A844W0P8_9RHOB|nr:PepSY domain-containing protein [Pseudooceanicola pacificus]MWB77307.1 PepSY domain-containing protein [Pseudooceanicola pacificus]
MTRFTTLAAAALIASTGAAFASSGHGVDDQTRAALTERFTAEGYDVRKIEMEDGEIEVYALKDGKRYELRLDDQMNVIKGGDKDGDE